MRRSLAIPLLSGALSLLVAIPVRAQEAGQDDLADELARIGLEAGPSLRREKRRQARRDGWVFTLIGTAAAGYDSNIHKGFSGTFIEMSTLAPERGSIGGSAIFDLGAKVEGLIYFSGRDRMKASLESMNSPYSATRDVSSYTQQADIFYGHRFRDWGSTTLAGQIKHASDSATSADGDEFERDFENMVYRARAGHRIEIGDEHAFKLSYSFKRKDYFEVNGLTSLDWWRHGPRLQYRFDCSNDVRLRTSYGFQQQLYDEDPAGDATTDMSTFGSDVDGPKEEHFFQVARFGVEWRMTNTLATAAGFRFRYKDDRFEGFESYYDYQGEFALNWFPTPFLSFEVGQRVSHRDYAERPEIDGDDGSGDTLTYDRYRTTFLTRYELSQHQAVYVVYGFDKRTSNRVGGASYRSYVQHTVSAGITLAY